MDQANISPYARQIHPDLLTDADQRTLSNAAVFILGLGGLGSVVSLYLASAGVGTLVLCDGDTVEQSNLNRQILHGHDRLGMQKTDSAGSTLSKAYPEIQTIMIPDRIITSSQLVAAAEGCAVLVDCSDSVETRKLLSEAATAMRIPLVHGGIRGWSGEVSVFYPEDETKLKAILPEKDVPGITPVIGATAGIIGSMEALETIKVLLDKPSVLRKKVLIYEGLSGTCTTYEK